MKRSIAALALSAASTPAFSLGLPVEMETKTVCLNEYQAADGLYRAGNCDQTPNNVRYRRELLSNGCAKEQMALTATRMRGSNGRFDVEVAVCPIPNHAQL